MFTITKFSTLRYTFSSSAMLSKVSIIVIIFLNCLTSNSEELSREKRADIDLQTCIANFDIHRDKIIRTQDSRNMGAKYLTEFDLGTLEECLRLCCETENCDVFVFEEKNSGGCYLFHCGPPEDFKCKFTHHANYSSAVLAINRHLPDLESQIKLTKHEQDLNKLKKPESEPEVIPQVAETRPITSTTPTTTIKLKEIFSTEMKTKGSGEVRKCRRYQFECRSTSECIAIYNACDGIPQCADGSDEAPELGCPDSLTTSPIPAHPSNPIQPVRYDSSIPQQPLHPLVPAMPQSELYRSQIAQETLGPPQLQAVPHQDADFLRPLPNSRNINSRVPFDNQQIVQYAPAPIPMQASNWNSHPNQIAPPIPQYADKNSHIFNHKEHGLQVPDGQEIRYNKYKGAMQYLHRALGYSNGGQLQYPNQYPKMSYYDYRQPIQQENWPNPAEELQYNSYPQENPSSKDWHPELPPKDKTAFSKTTTDRIMDSKGKIPTKQFPNEKFAPENPTHIQEKMAHELKHSSQHADHEVKIKIEKHKQTEHYPDVVAYKMEGNSDLEDGMPKTASGAVLSLTLGLILTCIMALLIGCRLRVRRRLRKGGKSYAHDADYLVNGMYL